MPFCLASNGLLLKVTGLPHVTLSRSALWSRDLSSSRRPLKVTIIDAKYLSGLDMKLVLEFLFRHIFR